MNKLPAYLVTLAGLVTLTPLQADSRLAMGIGYDSNPYRLNDQFDLRDDVYWKTELDLELGEDAPWLIDLSLETSQPAEQSEAERTSSELSLGYESLFLDDDLEVEWTVESRQSDRTYVSRVTGAVYAIGNAQAENRYDYEEVKPGVEIRYKVSKASRFDLEVTRQKRDYDDYQELGLSNLDYAQTNVELGWRYRWSKSFSTTVFGEYGQREYDDRLAKDIEGFEIDDLNSEYAYQTVGLRVFHRLSKKARWLGSFSLRERTDNGEGYYDANYLTLFLSHKYRFDDASELATSLYYSDIEYQRGQFTEDVESDAETPDTNGWRLRFTYLTPLFDMGEAPVSWYSELSLYQYDSPSSAYQYDRALVETGLQLTF